MRREGAGTSPDAVWSRIKARATSGKISDVRGSPNLLLQTPKDSSPPGPTHPPIPRTRGGTTPGSGAPRPHKRCGFPVTQKGAVYRSCTTVEDPGGETWCSTLTDASGNHIRGNWGHCNAACFGPAPAPRPRPRPTPRPTRTPTSRPQLPTPAPPLPSSTCKTVDGSADANKPCVFPFRIGGKEHRSCTSDGDPGGVPWCSTQTDASGNHIRGNWGHCNAACFGPAPALGPAGICSLGVGSSSSQSVWGRFTSQRNLRSLESMWDNFGSAAPPSSSSSSSSSTWLSIWSAFGDGSDASSTGNKKLWGNVAAPAQRYVWGDFAVGLNGPPTCLLGCPCLNSVKDERHLGCFAGLVMSNDENRQCTGNCDASVVDWLNNNKLDCSGPGGVLSPALSLAV
jgi:hypothetical protein